jgi:hypothetical protein
MDNKRLLSSEIGGARDEKMNLELAKINKAILELKANKNPHIRDDDDIEDEKI